MPEELTTTKARILIVEDERPMAKALELKFNKAGLDATAVNDGESAYELIKSKNFDFMLVDLIMPKLDGFGLLKMLKNENIQIPFIITSNLSQQSDIDIARELGARDFIIKSNSSVQNILDKVLICLNGSGEEALEDFSKKPLDLF